MDWLIWVIVIVLIVAVIWWFTTRNKGQVSPGSAARDSGPGTMSGRATGTPPGATQPSNAGSMPDTGAAAMGVAGLAGVDNHGEPGREDSAPETSEPTAGNREPTAGSTEPGDGVTADDVTRPDESADKAEWESSWTSGSGEPIERTHPAHAATPVHHSEYTSTHSPTLPGAETAAAEDSGGSGHLAAAHPYGGGSSSTEDPGYPVKANATTMTYHDDDAPDYPDVAADVWFESAAHAEAAGFRPPRRTKR
ncbi:hypothetical protein [Arthrobacter sp. fls2-241-R2A-200]|uniref:sunset domain-containing protein n=1 Tax=Arthrobacter sp. fls2-241-R2A-200 TaxID=3040281 RepID=UPI00254A18E7|nr:hypothetical protein [Arthrobacter sp. fls2-241-R2A-200]